MRSASHFPKTKYNYQIDNRPQANRLVITIQVAPLSTWYDQRNGKILIWDNKQPVRIAGEARRSLSNPGPQQTTLSYCAAGEEWGHTLLSVPSLTEFNASKPFCGVLGKRIKQDCFVELRQEVLIILVCWVGVFIFEFYALLIVDIILIVLSTISPLKQIPGKRRKSVN